MHEEVPACAGMTVPMIGKPCEAGPVKTVPGKLCMDRDKTFTEEYFSNLISELALLLTFHFSLK